jgi:hypothetical protein
MNKRSPLIRLAIRYGAIAGILCGVLLVATYYIGSHPLMVSPFMDYRILLFGVFIFFSLKEFREDYQNGALYFWQGMVGSFIFVMVAGTISALLVFGFCYAEPRFIPSYVIAFTEYLNTFSGEDIERIGKEVFESNLNALPATDGKQIAGKYFMQSITIGFFVSIILSVILRKQPKPD